ncbi:MAG: hypothetical protein JWN95_2591 [Frankiales bacterium]|nr:hypothetical protein [Frankiales bacterium]
MTPAEKVGWSSPEVRLLTLLIVLLIGIPSRLIFSPLGSAGTPALVLGMVMLVLWLAALITGYIRYDHQPLRVVTWLFLGAVMISYVAATTRPIDAVEIRAADRGLISVLGWVGILLFALDGPRSRADLDLLLRRLCWAGGLQGVFGIVQFATGLPLTNYLVIPGLTVNSDLGSVIGRDGLTRPAGTTIHPIEFGAVLTMILPIALHYALHDRHRKQAARWFPVVAIAAAVPISISRSAILSAAVVLLILLPTWARPLRRRAYAFIVALGLVLYVTVPGLIGTLTSLFTGISQDSSATSRTDSYQLATEFIARAPIFGRGFRTFLPTYRILDNQYLGLAIELGLVGVSIFLIFLLTATFGSMAVRRGNTDQSTRSLGQAFAASVGAAGLSFAVYDAFSFPMAASLLFLIVGCSGALRRLSPPQQRLHTEQRSKRGR